MSEQKFTNLADNLYVADDLVDGRLELGEGNDPIDEPEFEGPSRRHRVASEQVFHGDLHGNLAGEPMDAAPTGVDASSRSW